MSCRRLLQQVFCLTLTALLLSGCAGALPGPTVTPLPLTATPTLVPPTSTPTPVPPTATLRSTSTATPKPISKLDTGMGGNLSIQGVVRDSFGNVVPYVPVYLSVMEETVFWDKAGSSYHQLGDWDLHTDETGSYSFNNLTRMEKGHYEVWLSGDKNDEYEESGYYILEGGGAHLLSIGGGNNQTHFSTSHDQEGYTYTLDVTVHRVTNSALCAAIQYQDADGVIKNYLSKSLGPDHRLELNRGTNHLNGHEYTIGDHLFTSDGHKACSRGLAGGTYYLIFEYIRSDGKGVTCVSPSFEILPGETKQFEYTIRDCSP